MSVYLGDFPTSASVYFGFDSFAGSTGAPGATTNYAAGDIKIYKDLSTTERSSANGITVGGDTTGFDSRVGIQSILIDLSDNTDAGFYAAGHEYMVVVDTVTIDSQSMRFIAGYFSIERANGVLALLKAGTAKVTLADAVAHGGTLGSSTATLALSRFNATSQTANTSAFTATGNGTGNGIIATGGAGASGDGFEAVAGGGVDIRGNITGNLVGTVSTLTTYTGNTPQTGDVYALANGASGFVAIAGYIDTEVAAIKAKTDNLPAAPAAVGDAMTLTSAYNFAKGTVAVTESYSADGAAPTPVQALMLILQMLTDKSVTSTTLTVNKLDGSTAAATFTLDSSSSPTSITRAT